MRLLRGEGLTGGQANGAALVTRAPMNFTAAHTKPKNLFRMSVVQDRHHELYGQDLRDRVLVIPSCIGSTYTGMVLLELMYKGVSPAAIVVQEADSLLVSGAVLADVWFSRGVPIVEYREADLFDRVHTGDWLEVDGESGEIRVG